jgi:hypothetical protein
MQPAKSLKLGILALLFVALTIFPGCGGTAPPINHSPTIIILTADSSSININQSITITSIATDQDGDTLTYIWTKNGGTISGSGSTITWTAPATAGTYAITCIVSDGNGGQDSESINIVVTESDENKIKNVVHKFCQALSDQDWNEARSYCVYGSEAYELINEVEEEFYLADLETEGTIDINLSIDCINEIIINGEYAELYCNLTETDLEDGEVIIEMSGEVCFLLQKIGNDWRLYGAGGTTPECCPYWHDHCCCHRSN